jgi:flavin-dependent dehydrogenase
VSELQLDVDEYRRGRTFQPIIGFRTGIIGGGRAVETTYENVVSYGIRRCEFDHYLLERSGARLITGVPLTAVRREGARWVVNDRLTAALIVGAGGHFCPVARRLNGRLADSGMPLVVAQEAEFEAGSGEYATEAERPELYFCHDLKGYGARGRSCRTACCWRATPRVSHTRRAAKAFVRRSNRGCWPLR